MFCLVRSPCTSQGPVLTQPLLALLILTDGLSGWLYIDYPYNIPI